MSKAGMDKRATVYNDETAGDSEWVDVANLEQDLKSVYPIHYAASQGDKKNISAFLHQAKSDFEKKVILDNQDTHGRTPLIYAVVGRKNNAAKFLVDKGADVHVADAEGRTALHWAVYHDCQKMVTMLLKHGSDPAVLDNDGRSFAHLCSHGVKLKPNDPPTFSTKILVMLQKSVPQQEFYQLTDNRGMNALHWSCFHGSLPHSKELLKMGLDIMSRDSEGKTPAHWAATTQNVALMQQLVLAFSLHPFAKAARDDPSLRVCHIMNVPDNQGRTPLHVAVGIGNSAITELILSVEQAKVDIQDIHGRTPLHWAVQLGHPSMIQLLMAKGGPAQFDLLDANGWTALHYAAHEKYVDCAAELLKFDGVHDQADIHGQTALMLGILSVERDLVHLLIDKKISDIAAVDETGSTPLHVASFVGIPDFINRLVAAGADVNAEESLRQTPLFFACEQGHLDAVKALIRHGADVKHVESEGRSVLHFAAIGGHPSVCNHLLGKHDLNVNGVDVGGRSALHTAAHAGDGETAAVLIDRGADINLQDNEGITPLHWAAASGNVECVAVIMSTAFPNHTEYHHERFTPLDYAMMSHSENTELIAFMRGQGALQIGEIRGLAASHIQSWWVGYRSRIRMLAAWQQAMLEDQKNPGRNRRKTMAKKKDGTTVPVARSPVQAPTERKTQDAMKKRNNKMAIAQRPKTPGDDFAREKNPPVPRLGKKKRGKKDASDDTTAKQTKKGPPSDEERDVENAEKPGSGVKLAPIDGHEPRVRNSIARRQLDSRRSSQVTKPPHRVPPVKDKEKEPPVTAEELTRRRVAKVKSERNRVHFLRRKMEAANTIQRWWRKRRSTVDWDKVHHRQDDIRDAKKATQLAQTQKRMEHGLSRTQRAELEKQRREEEKRSITIDPLNDSQQIAALTIQLFWRQYMSRKRMVMKHADHWKKLITKHQGPTKILYPWSPEVMRQTRAQREAVVYNTATPRSKLIKWQPTEPRLKKVDVRQIPLVSVTAFNLATATYWPAEVQQRFDQKAAQLAKVEASADQVLDDFLANMKRVRQLKLDEMPKIAVGPIGMSDNHNPVYEALKKGKLPDPTSDLIKVVGSRSPPPNKLAASPRQTSVAVA